MRSLQRTTDSANPDAEDDSPSVMFAALSGVTSVVAGFAMVHYLGRNTTPSLAPWVIARGTGISLIVVSSALVSVGLWIAHPKRNKKKGVVHVITLNSIHKSLAGVALVLLFLHISSIASDKFAHVGIVGALVPFKSSYRTIPVALGTIATYLVLVVGFTAWLKFRGKFGNWKQIHKVAIVGYGLLLIHGILAGSDTVIIGYLYAVSAITVTTLLATRYHFDRPGTKKSVSPTDASGPR